VVCGLFFCKLVREGVYKLKGEDYLVWSCMRDEDGGQEVGVVIVGVSGLLFIDEISRRDFQPGGSSLAMLCCQNVSPLRDSRTFRPRRYLFPLSHPYLDVPKG